MASIAYKVACGSIMTADRVNECWPKHEETCECGKFLPDSVHTFWSCPLLATDSRPAVADTKWMAEEALIQLGEKPDRNEAATKKWEKTPLEAMWLRALIPKMAWPITPPANSYELVDGSWDRPKFKGRVATDGSGGRYTSDKDLRRCGWSAVQLDDLLPAKEWKWIAAPLAGMKQTVPRSELMAVIAVAENLDGDVELWSDCKTIVDTINQRKWAAAMCSSNCDLWERLKEAIDKAAWKLTFKWINSHPTEAIQMQTHIPIIAYAGNKRADELAREAADEIELLPSEVESHKDALEKAKAILNRLATIALDLYKNRPAKKMAEERKCR